MRTSHTSHTLPAFPVYSSAFLANDLLILGGGGGSSKSGVKNRVRLYQIQNGSKMEMLDELSLEDEDAPMSMAVNLNQKELICGINSSMQQLQKGENENCKIYNIKSQKIRFSRKCGTFQPDNGDEYQNVTTFSSEHNLLAVGCTKNELALRWYDSLSPAAQKINVQDGQLYDATFSPTSLVVATTTQLEIYPLPVARKGKGKKLYGLTSLATVKPPTSPVQGMTFRAARFHPTQPEILYTVLNVSPQRTRGKLSARRAYICSWNTKTWQVVKLRKVAEKSITCFDVSADGRLLAYGSSDYTIGILDSQTLAPLVSILKAHDFPPTTVRFNPDASLLVSGSADSSVRLIIVPKTFGSSSTMILLIVLTVLVLVLAIAIQQGVIF